MNTNDYQPKKKLHSPAIMANQTPYQSATEFLLDRIDYERTPSVPYQPQVLKLERMVRLLQLLGDPHHRLPVVHVAGSKGKGSTATMVASILQHGGYRTGLFTSPHLESVEERIRLDGQACTANELVALVEEIRPIVQRMDNEAASTHQHLGRPTYFELITAMAMKFFADKNVDMAVLEVGLGGRLDSTNVCRPLLTVITSISLDHTRQLGNTLAAIAAEKAGIIKPTIPVVSGVPEGEASQVIAEKAQSNGSRLWQIGHDFQFRYQPSARRSLNSNQHFAYSSFDYSADDPSLAGDWQGIELTMAGAHQASNAALALTVAQLLRANGWNLPNSTIRSGLRAAICPGRSQVVGVSPTVVLDTAHNAASIQATLGVLDEYGPAQQRTIVFAATRGKDVTNMLTHLIPACRRMILTRYEKNPRSHAPQKLLQLACELGPTDHVEIAETPESAWTKATELTPTDGLICVTGSFFLAAEIIPLLRTGSHFHQNQQLSN